MARLIPIHNNLVVEEFELGEISRGGLLIPQIAKASTPYRYAKVLEVGPGRYAADGRLIPVSVAVDDVVAFSRNQGYEFPLDDADGNEKTYRMLNEQFVLGKVVGMPQQSKLTGLDGRLLTMQPQSNARQDSSYRQLDDVARARVDGIIDTQGGTLDLMAAQDQIDHESEPS